ncbi:hypothetical protein [Staphylococcus aureus]|uniref:hypothetical protein n=1 Tax=Staphylococcus aureus TaxID=1280 RepID=UPI000DE49301|nr:hypothetical protein [Staphylococcus aureus]
MLKQLEDKLKEQNYDTEIDESGVYLPEIDVDIVLEDEGFIISIESASETQYRNTVDETLDLVQNLTLMNDMKKELAKVNLTYKEVDSHMIYVKDFSIFYENDGLFLEGSDGSVSSNSTPSEVISLLEDYGVI